MLAKFGKTPVADIALYVRDMDTDKLGLSALHALERFLPTSQEAKELGAYMEATNTTAGVLLAAVGLKSKKSSSRAEEYLFEMSKVPHVAERIRIMSLCESIDDSLLQLEADYDSMVRGVAEVKGSSRLLYILRTTVELVNALKMAGTTRPPHHPSLPPSLPPPAILTHSLTLSRRRLEPHRGY